MDKDFIYNVLSERGYNAYLAQLVAGDLSKLSEPLNDYLLSWLNDESYNGDFETNGYSISQLQTKRRMNYPAALLTMDWLMKEPEKAIESLNRKIK